MLTKRDIARKLKELGLNNGDIVILHSSLSSCGKVQGGAEAVVAAFLEVLGKDGTLVVPVFGNFGVIPKAVASLAGAVRSVHGCASIAAVGASAEQICRDHWKAETAHGKDTPYTRIADMGGYVCLLGVDQDRNTTLHSPEALLELPYLSDKTCVFETPEEQIEKTWKYFPGPHRNFIGLDKTFRDSGKMKIGRIGNSVVRLIRSRYLLDICLELGKRNPAFVLCGNPRCPDCKLQWGKIREASFSRESFVIASSSALAGRYVPEMIENLSEAGINRLELDYIQRLPVDMIPENKLSKYVFELREAKIAISALRSNGWGQSNLKLLDKAETLGIDRVVVPLHSQAEEFLRNAESRKITVSFSNNAISSQAAIEILQGLNSKGLQVGFTFNPANFASIGEKPFLESYQRKPKIYVDQLDICDQTYDGCDTPLAKGNAEIKELISILRCSSFSGYMVLAMGNSRVSSLVEATDSLLGLINSM